MDFNMMVFYAALLLTLSIQHVRSDQCPAPSPCTCSDTTIDCDNTNLTSVPVITGTTNTNYSLYLRWNTGLVIKDDAFNHVSLEYLNLDGATNTTISRHALASQRNTLKKISFINADLGEMPAAFADLDSIESISFSNNNLQHWDGHLMRKLGWTVTKLNIAYTGLTSWPTWISHIWNLVELNIAGNDIRFIPHDAFHMFASTLTHLNIEFTGISSMPSALATLHNLEFLFIGGSALSDSSFYETWLPSHNSSLKGLSISNTTITHIPLDLNTHNSIETLLIYTSNIKHIKEGALPKNLVNLRIVNSLLSRIDGGICSRDLKYLDLNNNKLTSIEKRDLYDCKSVVFLDFHENKIKYISPNAFNNFIDLHILNLKGNRVVNIPIAIAHVPYMLLLYLNNNPLECSCLDVWFPTWRERYLIKVYLQHVGHVYGRCMDYGVDLQDFNPHCPGTFIG